MTRRINRNLAVALAALAVTPWLVSAAVDSTREDSNTRINITGIGTAPQAAQSLTMQGGVGSFATTASRAVADNAATMDAIRRALARHGIDPRDIRTGELSLQPTSRREDDENIRGFQVTHSLTIVFRDIAKTGVVMDTLVGAGATQINGPRFSSDAPREAQVPARLAAIRDANQRAEFYAKALGMKVKRVVTMQDSNGYTSPQPAAVAHFEAAPATQISPGSETVQVYVSAQYELTR